MSKQEVNPLITEKNDLYNNQQFSQQPPFQQQFGGNFQQQQFSDNFQQQQQFGDLQQGNGNVAYYMCEANPNHTQVVAAKKCDLCNRLMCLKCSTTNSPALYGGNYRRGFMYQYTCCEGCSLRINDVKKKYSWIYYFHLITFIIGWLFFPIYFITFIIGIYYLIKLPKDKFHQYIRRTLMVYVIVSFTLLLIYAFTAVILILCFIPLY